MRKIYSKEELINGLENAGLKILGDIKTGNDKVLCMTKEGYKVLAIPSGVIKRKDTPSVFSKYNPYTIYNIKHYLEIENSTLELISKTYENSSKKLKWKCECGNLFDAGWVRIIGGKRFCNFCAKSKRYDGFYDYYSDIKNKCVENNYTLISESITRLNQKFEYVCNKHDLYGVQYSTYDWFIRSGEGCKCCGIESRGIKHRKIDEDKFKSLTESNGFIYKGYDYENYGKYKKVNILFLCPNHIEKGIQKIKYDNLQRSNGKCKYCIGRDRTQSDLQSELNEMGANITILKYENYASQIKVICNNCNHTWMTKGVNLTQGRGCPKCQSSNFEKECANILDNFGYNYLRQKWFTDCKDKNPLPFDFYLQDFNILIECDGEGHYKPIRYGSMTEDEANVNLLKVKLHDEIKTKYCNCNNIPLIRIPYWEKHNMEYFLWDELVKYKAIEEVV